MALADKQVLGTWNQTGMKLMARSFDEGTTFFIVEQKEGPSATADVFVLREETMLDRDDVVLVDGLDKAATKTALTDLTWPAGYSGGPLGLGYKVQPTNFDTPLGYATFLLSDGTFAFKKAVTTPSTQEVAASAAASAAAPTGGWLKRNLKWVIGGLVVAVLGVVTYFATKKKKKK